MTVATPGQYLCYTVLYNNVSIGVCYIKNLHLWLLLSQVIINSQIRNFLSEFDLNYSTESILQSEIRILKTLNYEVSTASPVTSLEIILEILGELYSVCITIFI